MTVIALAVARLLGISPDVARVAVIMTAIAAVLGSAWGAVEYIKHRGAEEARAQIERDNQDAIQKGVAAGRSLDDCLAAGGVWDFRRQRCAGPAHGAR